MEELQLRMEEMKKILVTGSGGFIGKNIVEQLDQSYKIISPRSYELNLLDEKAVREYLERNFFDVVIHSATRNTTRIKTTSGECLNDNLRMFFNLQRCGDLYGKMIYFGSGAEYDSAHYIPMIKEEYFDRYVPSDSYGFSKYIMAKNCEKCDNIYELCLFGVYGMYEEWERRFISNAICRALKGMDITLQKHARFDYLWVDDLVQILKWFIENEPKKKRYNVCRGESIDLYSLAEMVKEILGTDNSIVVKERGWKPEYSGDNRRLLMEIGGFCFTGLEEAVNILCEYYKRIIDEIDETRLI